MDALVFVCNAADDLPSQPQAIEAVPLVAGVQQAIASLSPEGSSGSSGQPRDKRRTKKGPEPDSNEEALAQRILARKNGPDPPTNRGWMIQMIREHFASLDGDEASFKALEGRIRGKIARIRCKAKEKEVRVPVAPPPAPPVVPPAAPPVAPPVARRRDLNPYEVNAVKQKVKDHLRKCFGCDKCRRWREELQRTKRLREQQQQQQQQRQRGPQDAPPAPPVAPAEAIETMCRIDMLTTEVERLRGMLADKQTETEKPTALGSYDNPTTDDASDDERLYWEKHAVVKEKHYKLIQRLATMDPFYRMIQQLKETRETHPAGHHGQYSDLEEIESMIQRSHRKLSDVKTMVGKERWDNAQAQVDGKNNLTDILRVLRVDLTRPQAMSQERKLWQAVDECIDTAQHTAKRAKTK